MSNPFAPLHNIIDLLSAFPHPWMFAGGWAIDLFLGSVTRPHKDVDVAIFREHQLDLQRCMRGWRMFIADSGRLEPWRAGDYIQLPRHTIWAYAPGSAACNVEVQPDLEVLFNERDEGNWVFRRNSLVARWLALVCLRTASGIPYLAPEIALLYKSKDPRDEDRADFNTVVGSMSGEQRTWLRDALETQSPGHEWLERI